MKNDYASDRSEHIRKIKSDSSLVPSVPYDIKSLTDYTNDSIVSRTITNNKSGTMTIFSFDAGQGLSEHSAPYDAIVQIIDGRALLTIGGKQIKASSGELVLMPADIPHAVFAEERFKMLLTMIKGK